MLYFSRQRPVAARLRGYMYAKVAMNTPRGLCTGHSDCAIQPHQHILEVPTARVINSLLRHSTAIESVDAYRCDYIDRYDL